MLITKYYLKPDVTNEKSCNLLWQLYLNGALVSTATNTPDTFYNSESIFIGQRHTPVDFLTGKMSCLQIFDRALEKEEIIRNQYRCQEQRDLEGNKFESN